MKNYLIIILISTVAISKKIVAQHYKSHFSEHYSDRIIDTVAVQENTLVLKARWMSDTIEIRQYFQPSSIVIDNFFRKLHKNKDYSPSKEEIEKHLNFRLLAAQNCLSYAMEMYFTSNDLNGYNLFNKETAIHEPSFRTILNDTFKLKQKFKISKNRKLGREVSFENNRLLVFYNQHDMIIHSVYFKNHSFYTKNGILSSKKRSKISEILNSYWDTKYIKTYSHL